MLELIGFIWLAGLALFVARGLWHTTTVDQVKPRRLRRTWSATDQAEFDALVGQPRGEA